MTVVRSSLFLAAAVLVLTTGFKTGPALFAQGPPPQPAPAGITTSRTWTDADYDKIMKEVGATVALLRKSIEGQNAETTKEQAEKLETLFEDADDFWHSRNVHDAMGFADDAAEHADHIEDAADGKDFAKAAEHLKLLQATCANCHGKFRDKAPDGTFRIKP
jgi:cytochrome c556